MLQKLLKDALNLRSNDDNNNNNNNNNNDFCGAYERILTWFC